MFLNDSQYQWLCFVRPKINNMINVLEKQYREDGAPEAWIKWSLEKTRALQDDGRLLLFVEMFLKQFWTTCSPGKWEFDTEGFFAARADSIKQLVSTGGVPPGVDLSYEPSPEAKEKLALYMGMLCDSHAHMVK